MPTAPGLSAALPAALPSALFNTHTPRPHQQAAVTALLASIGSEGRAQVVHACGAGKTRTAAMFTDQVAARTVLVTLPSLALVKQTMIEWGHQFGGNLDFRAVCSDRTVTPREELLVGQGQVLADPRDIGLFLAARSARVKVLFATYQSTPKVAAAVPLARGYGWAGFDVVVCDEAHRLAGNPHREYATVLHQTLIPATRRVFMTATPRLTQPGRTGADRVVGMNDPTVFGPVVHTYTFADATRDKVLTPYKLTILGVDPVDLTAVDWRADPDDAEVRHHIGLAATLRMMHAVKARRMVTYHATQARAERFTGDLKRLNDHQIRGAHVPDLAAVAVHANLPPVRRHLVMSLLQPHHRYPTVVSNPKVLTEGIDVPALDGVVFVDPRNSVVDTVQAVGRALRTAPGKRVGHIVVPVLMRPGDTAEDATRRGGFAMAWQVLATLRDLDHRLAAWLDGSDRSPARAVLPPMVDLAIPGTFSPVRADRLATVAKLRMVNQVATDPGPDTIEITCRCCGQFVEDRIYLNDNDPLPGLGR